MNSLRVEYSLLELKKMLTHALEYRIAFRKVDRELWDKKVAEIESEIERKEA